MLTATALANGCGYETVDPDTEPMLQALKQDPMATFRPASGGRIVLESEAPYDTFYKTTCAHVVRIFAFRSTKRARAVRLEAIDAARASGWRMYPRPETPDGLIFGTRKLATGPATLTVNAYDDEGLYKVSVWLEHIRCYPHQCRRASRAP
jgi:hypothetical protein